MPKTNPIAPKWAGRLPKWKIARIYEYDASGIHDQDLINDVAYTLLARCKSMMVVDAARNGHAACPVCESIVEHTAQKGSLLVCKSCGWTGLWDDYQGSLEGLHLIAPGLIPFCRVYVQRLPQVKALKKMMYWIDWLIHRCHWEGTALPGQPGATSLIQGRARDVNAFLDALSVGIQEPEGVGELGQYWSPAQKEQIVRWRAAADRRARKRKNDQATYRSGEHHD